MLPSFQKKISFILYSKLFYLEKSIFPFLNRDSESKNALYWCNLKSFLNREFTVLIYD